MKTLRGRRAARFAIPAGVAALAATALGQGNTADEIAKYRAALQDGNPAELWEARGEAMWKESRGPSKVSLQKCDLGLGSGVVKGAYAQLPRYFPDADRVMDLETRLVWCMVKLQGFTEADAVKNPFGAGNERKADMEALVAYVTSESRGMKMNVPQSHPKEREAYALGEKMFYFRGGTHDFACATCHGEDGKRIRLQDLPNLTTKAGRAEGLHDLAAIACRRASCARSSGAQRLLPPAALSRSFVFGSEASIDLTTFLAVTANGAKFDAPAIKR
jgi:sulfur-oxidizing protein SoxA